MVTGRRWAAEEFASLLVKHPLMSNLVRLLTWAAYDARGNKVGTFRVTEERELVDPKDKPVSLEGIAAVGIPIRWN